MAKLLASYMISNECAQSYIAIMGVEISLALISLNAYTHDTSNTKVASFPNNLHSLLATFEKCLINLCNVTHSW